jgi:hypothetical protein
VQDTPTFRVEIRERQKIEALLATLDFKSGPAPPGGLYAYEQQRSCSPPSTIRWLSRMPRSTRRNC